MLHVVRKKEEAISATGHTWNAVQTVDQEPTCTETGIKSIHCSICNVIKENSEEEIPLAAHTEVKDTAVPPDLHQAQERPKEAIVPYVILR